jgi:hypothetical protein
MNHRDGQRNAAKVIHSDLSTGRAKGAPMIDRPGSIAYLRSMAERCRRAAQELSGEEARDLVEIAERCEERLAERQRVGELVASEEH